MTSGISGALPRVGALPRPPACTAAPAEGERAAASAASPPPDRVEVSKAAAPPPADLGRAARATEAGPTPGPIGVCLRIILAGPPAAGKTTQGTAIAQAYGIPEISIGNLIREEMKAGTELGKQAEPYMKRGDLVPIEIVDALLERRLAQPDATRGFVLDGIGRRIEDADLVERLSEKMNLPPIPMLLIDVPDDVIKGRVENRRVCDNQHVYDLKAHPPKTPGRCDQDGLPLHRRPDDEPAVVAHRLEVYHQETQPVIEWYRAHDQLREVDGVGTIEEVRKRALDAARTLTTER
jgi:adenylate kinase